MYTPSNTSHHHAISPSKITLASNRNSFPSTSVNQSSLHESGAFFGPSTQLLSSYRNCKPNANTSICKPTNEINLIPNIICKIFNLETDIQKQPKETKQQPVDNNTNFIECACPKSEEGYCSLVQSWIDEEYFWKTDRRFTEIYQYYNRKKDEYQVIQLCDKLKSKLDILGVFCTPEKLKKIANILSNYRKHLRYYNKYDQLAAQSDLYIWLCLGLVYHVDIDPVQGQKSTKMGEEFIFWALDITMNKLGNLTHSSMVEQARILEKHISHYFPQWHKFLKQRLVYPTQLQHILVEWVSEMMFGYMGITFIGFFIGSISKMGWSYLYQVILSYFDERLKKIKTQQSFINGQLSSQMIVQKLIDSQEEWPIIFCSASTYKII